MISNLSLLNKFSSSLPKEMYKRSIENIDPDVKAFSLTKGTYLDTPPNSMAETFTTVLEMSTHSSPEGVEMGKIELT